MPKNTDSAGHRPDRAPIFTRPPLFHIMQDDFFPSYCEALSTLATVFQDMPIWMLEAAEDAAKAERMRREVIE